ncbi:trypsin, alkaline B-like [Aricia agestis]|uniref:trypsin, alkaline B-like n=1 Tax=Aricia agestis TaxID=91739 RepID=UPI001C20BB10|nr:trypsin, alkaline B-like [Aricia agestis]
MVAKYLAVFALFWAAYAAPEARIVGGEMTTIEDFPYISAFIYYYPGPGIYVQRCVGSIVSSWHILTTAFCFTGADLNNMFLRVGSTNSMSGGELAYIRDVIKHPEYVEAPRQGDIAVVTLQDPLRMSATVGVLFIPPQGTYIPDYTAVKIVSWGFETENGPQLEILKTIQLNKIPLEECVESYKDVDAVAIDDPVICASREGNYGVCNGDSGAPMVVGQVVVGLSSFYKECGNAAYPDVFTRIDRYSDWILSVAVAPTSNGTVVKTARVY